MKKLFKLRNVLIAIAFTVFLLLVKDNMGTVWGILGNILGILTPFMLGFLIAYILNFPYKFFYTKVFRKMGTKRQFWLSLKKPLSVICTYIIFAAVVAALIGIVVPQIAANVRTLYDNMPKYLQTAYNYVNSVYEFLNTHLHTNFSLDATVAELQSRIMKFVTNLDFTATADATKNVLGVVGNILTNTASGIYTFLMALIISIYFLASKQELCRQVKRLAVAFIPMKHLPRIYEIIDVTDTKCGRFLVGDILDAGLIGILIYIVMSVFHLPYAPMIAVLVGVTNIIPFFGPFIGGIPSALILFLVDPMDMVWFVIILVVIQQLDGNIFKPKIIGNQLGISSFWVLFSVVVGGAMFGLPGFILGTPIYAAIYTLIGKKVRNSIESKGQLAQEALDFDVLNYTKIAEEQKRLRAEKEQEQMEKLKKRLHLSKFLDKAENNGEEDSEADGEEMSEDNGEASVSENKEEKTDRFKKNIR